LYVGLRDFEYDVSIVLRRKSQRAVSNIWSSNRLELNVNFEIWTVLTNKFATSQSFCWRCWRSAFWRAILDNEVTRRVGPPHRPNSTAGCVRWGKQPGYVVFAGQKIPLERPRVRTREGQEVELESYGQLQHDGKLQRAVQERMVAGLSTRNYRRAVESVLEAYGIEKSSVSRQFVAASSMWCSPSFG